MLKTAATDLIDKIIVHVNQQLDKKIQEHVSKYLETHFDCKKIQEHVSKYLETHFDLELPVGGEAYQALSDRIEENVYESLSERIEENVYESFDERFHDLKCDYDTLFENLQNKIDFTEQRLL